MFRAFKSEIIQSDSLKMNNDTLDYIYDSEKLELFFLKKWEIIYFRDYYIASNDY